MGDFSASAEGQLSHEAGVNECLDVGEQPRPPNQQPTDTGAHDDQVVQRVDNGHKPVNGHHGQEEAVHSPEQVEGIHLDKAAGKGDGSALGPEVRQHLGDSGG